MPTEGFLKFYFDHLSSMHPSLWRDRKNPEC